jgi:hypothetical protein
MGKIVLYSLNSRYYGAAFMRISEYTLNVSLQA